MAAPYSSQGISGYNSNPPSDDGSATSANQIFWSTIKSKLPDPIKTLAEAINTAVLSAFGKVVGGNGVVSTAISYAIQASDQGGLVVGTAAGITITTPDATAVLEPFVFSYYNGSTGDQTLDGSGTQTVNSQLTLTIGAGEGFEIHTDGTNWFAVGRKPGSLPRSYLAGLTLSNGTDATNDIDIAVGTCRNSTNVDDMILASVLTKQLDAAWAVGSAAGGLDTGSIANTTYHVWLIKRSDTGVVDALFSTSATAPTMPTNYDRKRRIASLTREGGTLIAFEQLGDKFTRGTPVLDANSVVSSTTAANITISVPTGVAVEAFGNVLLSDLGAAGSNGVLIRTLAQADLSSGPATASLSQVQIAGSGVGAGHWRAVTNTSAQVARKMTNATGCTLQISTWGWFDQRGKSS